MNENPEDGNGQGSFLPAFPFTPHVFAQATTTKANATGQPQLVSLANQRLLPAPAAAPDLTPTTAAAHSAQLKIKLGANELPPSVVVGVVAPSM